MLIQRPDFHSHGMQAVPAATSDWVVKRKPQVIIAEEPVEG